MKYKVKAERIIYGENDFEAFRDCKEIGSGWTIKSIIEVKNG